MVIRAFALLLAITSFQTVLAPLAAMAVAQVAAYDKPYMTPAIEKAVSALEAKKYLEAHTLLKTESDKGNALAAYQLGSIYLLGLGTSPDRDVAMDWFEKAAGGGYFGGQIIMLQQALEKQDQGASQEWSRKLLEQTDTDTLLQAGAQCLDQGIFAQPPARLAVDLYLKAARNGSLEGQYRAGVIIMSAANDQKTFDQGGAMITDAADKGHAGALFELGRIYYEGRVAQKDEAKGLSLIRQSADKGFPGGLKAMARLYKQGGETPADKVEELMWGELHVALVDRKNPQEFALAFESYLSSAASSSSQAIIEANKRAQDKAVQWGDAGSAFLKAGGIQTYDCDRAQTSCYAPSVIRYSGSAVHGFPYGKGQLSLDGGATYDGQFKIGKKDGYGHYKYADGGSYLGDWKDDLRHGQGKMTKRNGEIQDGTWASGKFIKGRITMTLSNGDRYDGQQENGLRNGKGVYTFKNGDRKDGVWRDNAFVSGQARITLDNGDRYEGGLVNDMREGFGNYHYADGGRYAGNWVKGEKVGQGTFYFADGARYDGEWRSNDQNGQGTMIFANGNKYVGTWKNDEMQGEGTYHFANGNFCKGTWQDGKVYNGRGQYSGKWRDCRLEGNDIMFD